MYLWQCLFLLSTLPHIPVLWFLSRTHFGKRGYKIMKLWENTALTEKGIALQNKLFGGQTLKIKRVKAGAGAVPPVNLRQQTEISDEQQEITLQPVQTEGDKAVIPVLLENTDLKESYKLRQIGFYAEDPEEGEILYCIAQTAEGKNIPSASESPGFSITWNFCFQNSDTAPFEVVLDSAGLVTVEQHENHTKAIEKLEKSVEELKSLTTAINEMKSEISHLGTELNTKANQSGLNDANTKIKDLVRSQILQRSDITVSAGGTPEYQFTYNLPAGYKVLGFGGFACNTSNLSVYNAYVDEANSRVKCYIRNYAVSTNYSNQTIKFYIYYIRNL